MAFSISLLVFLETLYLIIRRPRRLHEAVFAAPGAIVLLLAGAIGWHDIAYIWKLVWNATLSLVGIMVLTSIMDDNGFFRWAAIHIVKKFHHRRMLLLAGLAGMAALVSTFFNNDGTVLIMTPIALEVTALLGMRGKARLAFLLGIGLMADTASSTLLVSNLTNILTADFFGISFGDYARQMLFPGLTASVATVAVLVVLFRGTIKTEGAANDAAFPEPGSAIKDRGLFRLSWTILAVIMAGYIVSGRLGVPVSAVACGGAALLWACAIARRQIDSKRLLKRTPWLIVIFALAMDLIVYSLHLHGVTDWFPRLLKPVAEHGAGTAIFGSGLLFSLLAAVMNNLPAVLLSSISIAQTHGPDILPFACLIGMSVGAKLTPIGSLATLLWLGLLRKDGVDVSWGQYLKYGILLTLPVLLLALSALWLQSCFF